MRQEREAHRELGRAYGLLSNLYLRLPDRGLRAALSAEIAPALSSLATLAAAHRWKGVGAEAAALASAIASLPAGHDPLARDFTKLFRGVRQGYGPKPPYESLYRHQDSIMGDISAAVRGAYRQSGLVPDKAFGTEPPDHIAFELSFLGHLHLLEADLRGKGDEKGAEAIARQRKSFVGDHLSLWGKEFCDAVGEAADTGFYKGVASLTREMLLLEQQ